MCGKRGKGSPWSLYGKNDKILLLISEKSTYLLSNGNHLRNKQMYDNCAVGMVWETITMRVSKGLTTIFSCQKHPWIIFRDTGKYIYVYISKEEAEFIQNCWNYKDNLIFGMFHSLSSVFNFLKSYVWWFFF